MTRTRVRPAPEPSMNKTEAAYGQVLELEKRAGRIRSVGFEAVKLRLAKATWYTPDFWLVMADGSVEAHEVKGGFVRDDAIVKLKVAARLFPWVRFLMVQKERGTKSWKVREIQPV